jgi:hypothetical protein
VPILLIEFPLTNSGVPILHLQGITPHGDGAAPCPYAAMNRHPLSLHQPQVCSPIANSARMRENAPSLSISPGRNAGLDLLDPQQIDSGVRSYLLKLA